MSTSRCHGLLLDHSCHCLDQRGDQGFAPTHSHHHPVVRGNLWRTLRDQHAKDDRFALDQREPGAAKDPAKVIIARPFGQLGTQEGQLFADLLCR
jgi:hypothetical protein